MRSISEVMSAERRQVFERLFGQAEVRSKKDSTRYGKSLRKAVPRDVFGAWRPQVSRPSAISLIAGQDSHRVSELVPVRHERMSASPFAFFRGAALVMAQDLSTVPTTGIEVQLCGDAHVANFGVFLSPERRTVFDINDFDETTRGPWEWDVARLAASLEVCGRDRGFSEKQRRCAVLAGVRAYREAMRSYAQMGNLEVWYAHVDFDSLMAEQDADARKGKGGKSAKSESKGSKRARKAIEKSKTKNSARAVSKFTEVVDGELRIVSNPPLIVPLQEIADGSGVRVPADLDMARVVSAVLARYRQTLPPERAALVRSYRGVDIAHKVVGVGSVGMRAWIVVLQGARPEDALVLQIKEATSSVLERFVGKAPQRNHGQRVVEGQHAIQAASDMLLGWTSLPDGKGRVRDYYVRQLWDGKGSPDLDRIGAKQLCKLAAVCGQTLAHAHARTGNRFAIAAYLGNSDLFDESMVTFSVAYADQNERDFEAFSSAGAAPASTDQAD